MLTVEVPSTGPLGGPMKQLFVCVAFSLVGGGTALAQQPPAGDPPAGTGVGAAVGVGVNAGPVAANVDANANATTSTTTSNSEAPPPEQKDGEKKPKRGDFDAGGQLRFPSGPGDDGTYGTFNFVGFDAKGRYFVLDQLTLDAAIPLAPKHAKPGGLETSMIGGFMVGPNLSIGKMLGLRLQLGMLKERAVLLSEKDAPIFVGDLKFATTVGPWIKFKRWGLDFNTAPSIVYQAGDESVTAVQLPLAASVSLGKLLKTSVETGIYTGDDFKLGPSGGGRIALGAAIDVKIGKIIAHAGAGVASLLTDEMGAYHSISDSVYVDLNAKYVK
jgi:hypothetical protein